ncbi:MAG: hypothetical protein QM715_04830 [Nibricoccus sp.]
MTTPATIDDEVGPLNVADWDFSRVPATEVIACCLWEYARESPSIGIAAEYHRLLMRTITKNETWGGLPSDKKALAQHIAQVDAQARAIGYHSETFLKRYWASDVAYIKFYETLRQTVSSNTKPWQEIAACHRAVFVQELDERSVLQPLSASLIGELEQLWQTNNGALKKVRNRIRPPNDDSEEFELYQTSIPYALPDEERLSATRKTVVAFTVDYSRYTDREIVHEFTRWLRTNRPKQWRRPSNLFPSVARGRKRNDFRVALERLGLMRLLHWNSPRQLRLKLPRAWKLYGQKQPVFRREIRGAVRFFRQFFPFLPKHEVPSSLERHTLWMRRFLGTQ